MTTGSSVDKLSEEILSIASVKNPQTVQDLISLTKVSVSYSEQEILDEILSLQGEGKLKVDGHLISVQKGFSKYLNGNQALWYEVVVVLAIITAIFTLMINADFYPWSYIRSGLGAIFVLWLPGYTLIRAIFPSYLGEKGKSNLRNAETIALSVIMSLAVVIIMGFILNFLPFGIRLVPIVLSLLIFTMVSATVAVTREYYIRNAK